MKCENCGSEINENEKFCGFCGTPINETTEEKVVTEQEEPAKAPEKEPVNTEKTSPETDKYGRPYRKSGIAIAGFVLGLVSMFLWIFPIAGLLVPIAGIVFSAMGLRTKEKTFAVIGLVISILFLIFHVVLIVAVLAAFGTAISLFNMSQSELQKIYEFFTPFMN